jgi:hypothetical protein
MPKLSAYGMHIFQTYQRLASFSSSNGFGANPITPGAVREWQELWNVKLPLFVVELVFDLDVIARRAHAARAKHEWASGSGKGPGVASEEA